MREKEKGEKLEYVSVVVDQIRMEIERMIWDGEETDRNEDKTQENEKERRGERTAIEDAKLGSSWEGTERVR